jgi:hypothetical protein
MRVGTTGQPAVHLAAIAASKPAGSHATISTGDVGLVGVDLGLQLRFVGCGGGGGENHAQQSNLLDHTQPLVQEMWDR